MTIEVVVASAKYLWIPVLAGFGYFLKRRDSKIDELESKLSSKITKEDVKELIHLTLLPLEAKIDRATESNMENTLLLREVSQSLNTLAKDLAVQSAINNHIYHKSVYRKSLAHVDSILAPISSCASIVALFLIISPSANIISTPHRFVALPRCLASLPFLLFLLV